MKTFLNVLYRKILYRIPLKFLLIILAIVAIFIASFSSAESVEDLTTYISTQSATVNSYSYHTIKQFTSSEYGTYCIYVSSLSTQDMFFGVNNSLSTNTNVGSYIYGSRGQFYVCSYVDVKYLFVYNNSSSTSHIDYKLFKLNALMATQLPVMTSLECQSAYSLIPISSVDQNYCSSNNLCPSSDCPICPSGSGGLYSNVYINDIFHPSAFNIIINIPEEIDWDYAYTGSGTNLNIDVVGYNVDYTYIDDVVDTQTYKPNSEDLSNIVSSVLPLFVPGLVIILLIYFIFRFIKKIF